MKPACTPSRWWSLLWSDYLAHYSYKREPASRARLLFPLRLLTNSSLHGSLLLRLTLSGPRPIRWLWRALLLVTHGFSVTGDCEIGPGLQMTHPLGLSIGPAVKVGRDAALFHGITLVGDIEADRPLVVGDRVEIFPGSVVEGALMLGDGCIVGANAFLTRDLQAGEVYTVRSDRHERTSAQGLEQGAPPPPQPVTLEPPPDDQLPACPYSLTELLRSDYFASRGHHASLLKLSITVLHDRSMRVIALVRLIQKMPTWQSWLWRRLMLVHGCDVSRRCVIGPGLRIPCPFGVVVGETVIGAGATLHQNISMSSAAREWRADSRLGLLRVGDDVTVMPGAAVLGAIEIGSGAVVGPNSMVTRSLPDHQRFDNALSIGVDELPGRAHSPLRYAVRRQASSSMLLLGLHRAGPGTARLFRALLGLVHQIRVEEDVTVGEGVEMPRPVWVSIGRATCVGRGSRIQNRVTVTGGVRVGDGVELGAGAILQGPLDVPAMSRVPANHVVVVRGSSSSVTRD